MTRSRNPSSYFAGTCVFSTYTIIDELYAILTARFPAEIEVIQNMEGLVNLQYCNLARNKIREISNSLDNNTALVELNIAGALPNATASGHQPSARYLSSAQRALSGALRAHCRAPRTLSLNPKT